MPAHPRLAVGAIVRDGDALLLVLRGREPAAGTWSLPGGKVAWGESLEDALRREVREETGLEVSSTGQAGIAERITRGDDGAVEHHFVIVDLWAKVASRTEPVAGDDAREARWFPIGDVPGLNLTPGLLAFLRAQGALD